MHIVIGQDQKKWIIRMLSEKCNTLVSKPVRQVFALLSTAQTRHVPVFVVRVFVGIEIGARLAGIMTSDV